MIWGNLVRLHCAVVPLAGGGVEPNLGDLHSAFLMIGLETLPFAVREAEVTSHVDRRPLLTHDANAQYVVVIGGTMIIIPAKIWTWRQDLHVNCYRIQVLPLKEVDVCPANVWRIQLKDYTICQMMVGVTVPVYPRAPLPET